MKINVDAADFKEYNKGGIGVIARGMEGDCKVTHLVSKQSHYDGGTCSARGSEGCYVSWLGIYNC